MKEAFDLIRKRMKEQTDFLSDCTKYGNKDAKQQEKSYSTMYMYEIADMVEDLIDIVSEVEAEYGNDVCEWKLEEGMFIQNPHTGRKFSNEPSMKNVYCNTCGKKIKVVE